MKLQRLSISGFRGIRQLEVVFPGMVTLIAGKNNCGKSTLLEAVEMLACVSDAIKVARINLRREFKCDSLADMTSFFYAQDDSHDVKLAGHFDAEVFRTVELSSHTPQQGDLSAVNVLTAQPKEYRIRYWEQAGAKDAEAGQLRFYEIPSGQLQWEVLNEAPLNSWKSAFCSAGNEPKTCDVVSELKAACNEDWLVEYLKSLDPNIVDITTDGNRILLKTQLPKSLLPLQLMGDGVNKVVKILGLMCSVGEGGVVCIDEIDNGLHFSAMQRLVELIVRVAQERKVQVLMTTHNLEFMRKISSCIDENAESFGFLRMVHCADGETKAFAYSSREYAASLKGGIELR